MTERRRPLENDDGQGALFGGEAFAPAGQAPAWKRPAASASPAPEAPAAQRSAASASPAPEGPAAPSLEAQVDVDAPAESEAPTPHVAAGADADVAAPRGFEPGADVDATDALGRGTAAPTSPSPFADEIAELERATEGHSPQRPRAPLAGPTLDDVMSRVWEGLVTGLPAACPVCHGEITPALTGPPHGSCSSCGTMID